MVGESGCGKSTIASALMRLLPANGEIESGKITFNNQDLTTLSSEAMRELSGREIAMIFQDPMTSLNPVFSIATQIYDIQVEKFKSLNGNRTELRKRMMEILTRVGIPDVVERVNNFPHQFSGGMRQRIMIAMALICRPFLLIADEPTSALDVTLEAQILKLLKELRDENGTSILFITHDLGVVAQTCDRMVVMYAGRVVEEGKVKDIFTSPKHPYTQALLEAIPSFRRRNETLKTIPGRVPGLSNLPRGCKFFERCNFGQQVCQSAEPAWRAVEDRHIRCYRDDPLSGYVKNAQLAIDSRVTTGVIKSKAIEKEQVIEQKHAPYIQINQLCTYFYQSRNPLQRLGKKSDQRIKAVDHVNLTINYGDVIGLVGESGSGKTTLGRTILGLQPATSGQILIEGHEITKANKNEMRKLRNKIQMIFQDPHSSLSPRLTISFLLTEAYDLLKTPSGERYSASQLLEMVGLGEELSGKYAHELSGGQARRVGIARALALRPKFLVSDEPTSGLDISVAASILNTMKQLQCQLDLTYLIITHNLNVVGYLANRIAVMYLGKIVEIGQTEDIFNQPSHPYTAALLSEITEPTLAYQPEHHPIILTGEIPSPKNPPPGCCFHTRCWMSQSRCSTEVPLMENVNTGHESACFYWREVNKMRSA